jgi:hypothetical protein
MKTKFLTSVLVTAILLSLVTVSALNFAVSTPSTLSKSVSSTKITVTNSENTSLTFAVSVPASIVDGSENSVSLSASETSFTLDAGANKDVTITMGDVPEGFTIGKYSNTVKVSSGSDERSVNLVFDNTFCSKGQIDSSNLDLRVSVDNLGDGDETEWMPLDEITLEVTLKNNKNVDLSSVVFEVGLIDKGTGENVASDMLWISDDEEKTEVGDIDSDEEDSYTFDFRVDPAIAEGNYLLVVKAYPSGDEETTCVDSSKDFDDSFYQEIKATKEDSKGDKAVVVDLQNLNLPIMATCGDSVTFKARIYNIGDKDQKQVKVNLFNKELGLNIDKVVKSLDMGDKADVEFTFALPENAQNKQYNLELRTYYTYDKNDDEYSDSSETFLATIKVDGNCVSDKSALITASLQSEASEGKQLVIKGTVKNTGTGQTAYTLYVSGQDSWATLDKIDPSVVTLNAGESKDFLIYLNVKDDTAGEQLLNIKADYGTGVKQQDVTVSVQSSGANAGITGQTIADSLRTNWFIWVIVIINVILIIAIIVVARRIVTSK